VEVARDPVVIVPVAAIEQHGPHLPLSTDADICQGLVEGAFAHIPEDLPAWVVPPICVGTSREHAAFAGTLSLEPDSLERVVVQMGMSLARAGVRRLVLANAHGGNRHALDTAALTLRNQAQMLVVKADYFRFPRPTTLGLPESEWTNGLHGGAVETAMMLHLCPERVRVEQIANAPSLGEELEGSLALVRPQGPAAFAWLAQDLSPSGVTGDPRRADPGMGALLVEHYARVLGRVIVDAAAFPIERLKV